MSQVHECTWVFLLVIFVKRRPADLGSLNFFQFSSGISMFFQQPWPFHDEESARTACSVTRKNVRSKRGRTRQRWFSSGGADEAGAVDMCWLSHRIHVCYIIYGNIDHQYTPNVSIYIEWASAQVPPTPLYLGGTVGRERERERDRVGEGEMDGWIDGWMDGRMDGWMDR